MVLMECPGGAGLLQNCQINTPDINIKVISLKIEIHDNP